MPPKSAKRAGQVAVASAKKQKLDPALAHVIGAIELSDLPEDGRKILVAGAQAALRTTIESRHEVQKKMVGMIEETILTVKSKYQRDLDEENSKVTGAETRKIDLEKTQSECQEVLTQATETAKAKKQVLDDTVDALKVAQKSLSEAKKVQISEDASLMELSVTKAKLEGAIQNHLSVIQTGDTGGLGAHYSALKKLFKLLPVEESMLGALECACKKMSSERGSFDTMVLEQLGVQFGGKVAELGQKIEDLTPASQQRAETVRLAEKGLEEAAVSKEGASSELEVARQAEKEAQAALKTATSAIKEYEPEFASATAVRDEKSEILDTFIRVNLAHFEKMRDRSSTPSEECA